jgi:hypothetical protein
VVSPRHAWPGVQPGDVVWAKGLLRLEPLALGRKNTHFMEAVHAVAVLRRYRPGPGEETPRKPCHNYVYASAE